MEPDFTDFDWSILKYEDDYEQQDNLLKEYFDFIKCIPTHQEYFKSFCHELTGYADAAIQKMINEFQPQLFKYRETKKIKLSQDKNVIELNKLVSLDFYATNFRLQCNEKDLKNIKEIEVTIGGTIISNYDFKYDTMINSFMDHELKYIPKTIEIIDLFDPPKYELSDKQINGYLLNTLKVSHNTILQMLQFHCTTFYIQNNVCDDLYFEFDIYDSEVHNRSIIISEVHGNSSETISLEREHSYTTNICYNYMATGLMIDLHDTHTNYNLKDIASYIILELDNFKYIISNKMLCLFYQIHKNNNIPFYETLSTELMVLPAVQDSKITLHFKIGLKGNMCADIAYLNLNIIRYNNGMGGVTYSS